MGEHVKPDNQYNTGTGWDSACGGTKTEKAMGQPHALDSCSYNRTHPPAQRDALVSLIEVVMHVAPKIE